ncbi:SCF ubiquitin ligase complex subunit cdc4 [Marasmius crinis-equi]|uniref:SCF ubiquitin ligase complex subunit cdc4 n=1 Tax=Marasmius crinis-equi TaxID=585013 RepID=A0ABR3EY12_9AGAR
MPFSHNQASDIYASALCSLGFGYPLWIPEPNNALPDDYKKKGVRTGDVGVLTDDGGFDFVFNACVSATDPINVNGVPESFQPLVRNPKQRREILRKHGGGLPILSLGAETKRIDFQVSAGVPTQAGFIGGGGGFKIAFGGETGAVVIPSNGADGEDCQDVGVFLEYALIHAAEWYQFVNSTLRRDVRNGDLYFITGYDKTDCWENAVVKNESQEQACELTFSVGPADGRLRLSHSSMQTAFSSRSSMEDNIDKNQTLFLRGYRVCIRRGIVGQFIGRPQVGAKRTDNMDPDEFRHRRGGNTPFSPSPAGGRISTSETAYTTDGSGHRVESKAPRIYHPLNTINDYILNSDPSIQVVATHDKDWISWLRKEDTAMPDDSTLLGRFRASSRIAVVNGCAVIEPLDADLDEIVVPSASEFDFDMGNRWEHPAQQDFPDNNLNPGQNYDTAGIGQVVQ